MAWWAVVAALSGLSLSSCATAPSPPANADSLCDALFGHGKTRFIGRGYANKRNTNAGFLWVTFVPSESDSGVIHSARVRSFFGARLFRHKTFSSGQCQNTKDPRFALITFETTEDASLKLWLWGENNTPQHESRLMGYLAFSERDGAGTKIALWNR